MSCINCTCGRCEADRESSRQFGELFPCEFCGEPGMSTVTTYGSMIHDCQQKQEAREARRAHA